MGQSLVTMFRSFMLGRLLGAESLLVLLLARICLCGDANCVFAVQL